MRNLRLARDMRYALEVMEEYSHLGLDDEKAGAIRSILLRQIAENEAPLVPSAHLSGGSFGHGEKISEPRMERAEVA